MPEWFTDFLTCQSPDRNIHVFLTGEEFKKDTTCLGESSALQNDHCVLLNVHDSVILNSK